MKEHMDSMAKEFKIKLERVKRDLEIDYLHRITAIEACYKELATTVITTKESLLLPPTPPLLRSPQRPRAVSTISGTAAQLGAPPFASNKNSILLNTNDVAEDYFAEQEFKLLSFINRSHINNGQGGYIR